MSKQGKTGNSSRKIESPLEELEIGSAVYLTRLTSKFVHRPRWRRPDQRKIHAVIPGTVQKLLVGEGDQVEAGAPLLILEAMKMRNEIRAPEGGIIKKIHVREGEQVPKAHLLLEFSEPQG
jgi:biotin carboxyl carrier protein